MGMEREIQNATFLGEIVIFFNPRQLLNRRFVQTDTATD